MQFSSMAFHSFLWCLARLWHLTSVSALGKVAVSEIINYLRHTTSWDSEDSGLEELCNKLDPEHKDISMDLETYHAIMGKWFEDRNIKW